VHFTFGGGYILVTKVGNFPTSFFNMNLFNNILFRSDHKNKCVAPSDELFQNEYKNGLNMIFVLVKKKV